MNRCFTTMGYYEENIVSPTHFTGPSISKEEQIKRLEALKSVKYKRESTQMRQSKSRCNE